jgi:2-keto-4-pentenoate hydratase/2-oxohepta-3-ene-1,7-dioic acid hydratase in catechol pathway
MAKVSLAGNRVEVASIFCVGRNYAAHIAELGNVQEEMPLVFLKPHRALLPAGADLHLPAYSSDVHYECELVLLIGQDADDLTPEQALGVVAGYGLGLDLTARDVQSVLKEKGHPWTRAKGFRGSACVSGFVEAARITDPGKLNFTLSINGEVRQRGDTAMMLTSVARLVSWLSAEYGLSAGDLIYTGTPAGVGRLHAGDALDARMGDLVSAKWTVAQ